jgi:hypothetical protein
LRQTQRITKADGKNDVIKVMNSPIHTFSDLFAQLGLPSDELAIQAFIAAHTPLAAAVGLPDSDCWTRAQAAFLRESMLQDSDWAVLVDQLSASLRGPASTST